MSGIRWTRYREVRERHHQRLDTKSLLCWWRTDTRSEGDPLLRGGAEELDV